jgi:zinc D-Ala-D-Ala carboxypeptidase
MQHTVLLQALGISPALIAARRLPPCPEAQQLTVAESGEDGKEHLLIPDAAEAWKHLKAAAAAEGIPLAIVSAFRGVDRQVEIIKRKLSNGQKLEDILCVSAPPGFSEHHTGRAVDVGTVGVPDLDSAFEGTPAFAWLARHAQRFGFKLSYPPENPHGYQYEPWHWCYAAQQGVPGSRAPRGGGGPRTPPGVPPQK